MPTREHCTIVHAKASSTLVEMDNSARYEAACVRPGQNIVVVLGFLKENV